MPAVTGYEELQDRLGYVFRDPALLQLALTHPSVAHEQGSPVQTNQRLEFLGDAVLQLVLTRELYEKFPAFGEGPLTKARAKLVNRRTLAERARHLGIGPHLILSRGEELHGGRERPSALADTYEALLGAVFLDGGFEAARDFILRQFQAAFGGLSVIPILENPKGELQELLQVGSRPKPRSIMWFPPPAPTTTGFSSAPCIMAAWSWRAARARARKPPRAKPLWPRWQSCARRRRSAREITV